MVLIKSSIPANMLIRLDFFFWLQEQKKKRVYRLQVGTRTQEECIMRMLNAQRLGNILSRLRQF